jgi:peptidoglycan/LPS O-acetylase OafA/YrhL
MGEFSPWLPAMNSLPQQNRFCFPDSLRGLAALWVFGQHLWVDRHTEHLFQVLPSWVNRVVFQFGYLGVPIFFVMSGFFMAHSLRHIQVTWRSFQFLLLKRFLRLSPAYYVSIILAIGLGAIAAHGQGTPWQLPSWKDWLTHLTYLQGIFPSSVINGVYWTLCVEFQFYLVFCLLLGVSQWLRQGWFWQQAPVVVFSIAALVSTLWPAKVLADTFPIPGLFLPYWHSCLLGAFAYWIWQKSCPAVVFYGYVGLLVGITIATSSLFTGVALLTAVSLVLVGRSDRMGTTMNWPWLQFVGLTSYTLYLTHEPLLKLLFPIGHRWLGEGLAIDLVCLAVNLMLCLGLAQLLHCWVEKPSIRWSQEISKKLNPIG